MGLSESVEKLLQNQNGQMSLNGLYEALGNTYARQTILDFVKKEKDLISFDGENIALIKYPFYFFIRSIEDFSEQTGLSREKAFYLGALLLFFKKQFPEKQFNDFLQSQIREDDLTPEFFDYPELLNITNQFREKTEHVFRSDFFEGWFEKLDAKEFLTFCQEVYGHFIHAYTKRQVLFSTPDTLVQLICRIIPQNQSLKIYNPAAGMLKLLTSVYVNSGGEIHAVASELNPEIYHIGKLFALTNGFRPEFHNADSGEEINRLNPSSFDLIISVPPFLAKNDRFNHQKDSYNDVALDIISGSIRKLRENGMAIFLISDHVLFGQTRNFQRFRREIIQSRMLRTVVSLPVNLFSPEASLKSSLLLFRKDTHHHSVRFIDASSGKFYSITRDKSISLETDLIVDLINKPPDADQVQEGQVRYGYPDMLDLNYHMLMEGKYSLNLNEYFLQHILPLESNYTELGKIVSQYKLPANNNFDLPYVRITDLNRDVLDVTHKLQRNNSRNKGKILNKQAILIGLVGGSSKPTLFRSESPVELSNNIVALKVDPGKANVEYVLQELRSDYVQKQMEFLALGSTTLKHLRIEDLLKVKVKLPPLNDQIRIVTERKEFVREQSLSVKKDQDAITEAMIFKTLNHEIGNILKGPEGFLSLLPDFLNAHHIDLNTPIVNIPEADSVGKMISMAETKIQNVFDVLENMQGILFSDTKYLKIENLELSRYLTEQFNLELINSNIRFYFGIEDNFLKQKQIYAEIDPKQFAYIVRNIVKNAMNHSGIDFLNTHQLSIFADVIPDEHELEIHFMNNGNTFPVNFTVDDFIGFHKKSAGSTGQGLGGYLIKKVIDNHLGKLSILSIKRSITVPDLVGSKTLEANADVVITIPKKQ